MKIINQRDTRFMEKLRDQVEDGYLKINNSDTFMPLVVERVSVTHIGELWSFAHYGEQNGDLMRDPDVELLRFPSGKWTPSNIRNDYLHSNRPGLEFNAEGDITGFYPRAQKDIAAFLGPWFRNVRLQQEL